ncbi:lipoate--protein ligase family protein [Marinomonas colpomeniae]|uniref:Lipoate--protein ligase n=1 Tax=Marinomonas colpomeniae TaxID=2774408 RepID=A0ABR8NZ27_9GAMM|nr:lipoate--protein ligase [Marinomonas colpomeniae]MBD5771296.1 lipoate--protein ligase [Marinomonas colpomeniae]
MQTNKYKIVRLTDTTVSNAFEKEAELLNQVQTGNLKQALLLWQAEGKTIVLPASKKWQANPELVAQLQKDGWKILPRRTGGAPVPQTSGVINISHIYLCDQQSPDLIKQGYEDLCNVLTLFFKQLNIAADIHATPYSYCDGSYNVNIQGKKIIGTAQRILTTQSKTKIVLVQACILIDVVIEELIYPINVCYELNQNDGRIKPEVHTCLAQHLKIVPTTEELYSGLVKAFMDYQSRITEQATKQ